MTEQPEHTIVLPADEFDRLLKWLDEPPAEPSAEAVELFRRARLRRGERP
jgi:hypothetical protein